LVCSLLAFLKCKSAHDFVEYVYFHHVSSVCCLNAVRTGRPQGFRTVADRSSVLVNLVHFSPSLLGVTYIVIIPCLDAQETLENCGQCPIFSLISFSGV